MKRAESKFPRGISFSGGLCLFALLVVFQVGFELGNCQSASEEDAGSPCYQMGEDGQMLNARGLRRTNAKVLNFLELLELLNCPSTKMLEFLILLRLGV